MSEYVNNKCLKAGMTIEESVQAYADMAPDFNEYVAGIKYLAPNKTAELTSDLFPDKRNVKILDLACGTGLVAESLHKLGFCHIDGVDPAQGMLDVARSKNVYNQLMCSYIGVGDSKLPLENDSYDAVTLCGGMGQNMMPCDGLHEMIRLVKPGGYIVNIFREEILSKVEEYVDRLEPLMESLQQQGKWTCVLRQKYPEYQVDKVGIINIHQIC